jgi:4,5-DOPA dioxygenase extradiol
MPKLPSLFLSHGAPSLILEDVPARHFLEQIGQQFPTPSAILVASAHWEASGPKVSAATAPKTIHDFSGFPAALYAMTYPAPGAPALAETAVQRLRDAVRPAIIDEQRGLGHAQPSERGAFSAAFRGPRRRHPRPSRPAIAWQHRLGSPGDGRLRLRLGRFWEIDDARHSSRRG